MAGRFLMVVLAGVALGGCERGCLSAWLGDQGAAQPGRPGTPARGGAGPRGSGSRTAASPASDLGGTDCSDGLARCVDGQVEISLAAHVPEPCVSPKERVGECACPWRAVGSCARGCVKEGLDVVATPDVALVQLCNDEAALVRPLLSTETTEVTICADEGVTCVDGIVRSCASRGQPARRIAACVHGCAAGATLEPDDLLTGDGPSAILCRHAHAERR